MYDKVVEARGSSGMPWSQGSGKGKKIKIQPCRLEPRSRDVVGNAWYSVIEGAKGHKKGKTHGSSFERFVSFFRAEGASSLILLLACNLLDCS